MKLTGKLKTQVDNAPTKEEKRDAIKKAGMLLSDDELDQVAGGEWSPRRGGGCPYNSYCYDLYNNPDHCLDCKWREG